MGSFTVRTVNGKQANNEHFNVGFLQFEEAFFDKLVHKTCLFLPVYIMEIITVRKMEAFIFSEWENNCYNKMCVQNTSTKFA